MIREVDLRSSKSYAELCRLSDVHGFTVTPVALPTANKLCPDNGDLDDEFRDGDAALGSQSAAIRGGLASPPPPSSSSSAGSIPSKNAALRECLIQLGTWPIAVACGEGGSHAEAVEVAARNALRCLQYLAGKRDK